MCSVLRIQTVRVALKINVLTLVPLTSHLLSRCNLVALCSLFRFASCRSGTHATRPPVGTMLRIDGVRILVIALENGAFDMQPMICSSLRCVRLVAL
eukprot:scaffold330389_cov73-Tisochrysis_lutea.AAC.1